MIKETYDFYSPFNFKLYNLNPKIQYQLDLLASHDLLTRKHSENVANLVYRLCEYLHCSYKFTFYCTCCAFLHDIGKLFIPLDILTKPDSLSEDEFEIMKTHTTLGYDLCYKDLELRPYADGALYHHESLNGTGYPNGVTKKDIPYMAQILRVADEYDALVSKRHYKTHINISEALKILIKDAQVEEYAKTIALDQLSKDSKLGKINPKVLKKLFKVVIDDTMYEIACIKEYVSHLSNEVDRLKLIDSFNTKMNSTTKDKKRTYYLNGMKELLKKGETTENYKKVLEDYITAIDNKKFMINKLYDEIKIIKKLKVQEKRTLIRLYLSKTLKSPHLCS